MITLDIPSIAARVYDICSSIVYTAGRNMYTYNVYNSFMYTVYTNSTVYKTIIIHMS